MVRKHEWKDFERSARELFAKNPACTRFSLKHTSKTISETQKKQTVVLKVTNNIETITYETNERFGVKRISALTRWLTIRMASTSPEQVKDEASLKQKLVH